MKLNAFKKTYRPRKISKKSGILWVWMSCGIFLFLQSCAGPRFIISPDTPFYPEARDLVDSLEYFKGFGDIDLLMDGEFNRAKIATRASSESQLTTEIFSIFGGTVARMQAQRESVFIDIGERSYSIGRDQGFEEIAFLRKYPFTFNQFARIITGRSLLTKLLVSPADSVWMEKREIFYVWRTDSVEVTLQGSRRRKQIERIAYSALKGPDWSVILSDLREGVAREIQIHIGKENYFKIDYDRICLNPDGC